MEITVSAADTSQTVDCPNCGGPLSYQPGTTRLICEHCGSAFEIKVENATPQDAQKENDLMAALAGNWQALQPQEQAFVVKCPACGAETALEKNMFSSNCTFCGTPISVQPDIRSVAHPQAVLPFKIDKQAASAVYSNWLRKLWFAPNNLKTAASSDRFNGVYLPFWTFDANTETSYRGERGDHYTETQRREVNGRVENVQVTKTRWSWVSGRVRRSFNDILVTASRALPEKYLNRLEPWDLPSLMPYDLRFLTGFKAEVSQVVIAEGYEKAKQFMAQVIVQDIRQDIGGNEQRIHEVQTNYSATTYKYILLPVWLSVFRYGDKIYRFVVNARTGEVQGERPYSAIKIALAVLAALIVIGLLILITGQH
jgi:DNA-directed RNA polymerase subunit M/transcription elongation factor TFIIS